MGSLIGVVQHTEYAPVAHFRFRDLCYPLFVDEEGPWLWHVPSDGEGLSPQLEASGLFASPRLPPGAGVVCYRVFVVVASFTNYPCLATAGTWAVW